MAGIHNDTTMHRLVSGEAPRVGLRVLNNDLQWGTIVKVATDAGCGYYCNAWHDVDVDGGGRSGFNCERLTTRDMITGKKDPHPERGYLPTAQFTDVVQNAIRAAADLYGPVQAREDNAEYLRALVELICTVHGLDIDEYRDAVSEAIST